ncbi:MAG: class I SAM-dependent methyltransferase [Actinomycetota bacterium]|nr:class I SAM-dependent methyltransferase [Actinomycetota bacterium]
MATPASWLQRWDAQQETYLPDREERFEVLVDLVEAVAGPCPRVVDLACGPASFAARILTRLPEAEVVGVDADPVLLALARSTTPSGLTLVDADLREPGWVRKIPAGPYDAVVSTTALHWLNEPDLRQVYAACAALLRSGGLLANGDHLRTSASGRLVELALELDRRRAARHGTGDEDWAAWWTAVRHDPELGDAVAERDRRAFHHPEHSETSREVHERALRIAGFSEVDVLWCKGTDTVLAALR